MAYLFLSRRSWAILIFTAGPVLASLGLSLLPVERVPAARVHRRRQLPAPDEGHTRGGELREHDPVRALGRGSADCRVAFARPWHAATQEGGTSLLCAYSLLPCPFLCPVQLPPSSWGTCCITSSVPSTTISGRLGIPRMPWLTSPGWVLNTIVTHLHLAAHGIHAHPLHRWAQ